MKFVGFLSRTLRLLTLLSLGGLMFPADGQVSPQLFDMSMNGGVVANWQPQPWPVDSFTSSRVMGGGAGWSEINTAQGVYDWTILDAWLAASQQHNIQILYTFLFTPRWASSNPNDRNCSSQPGTCDPPDDLNSDGSGTDQHWKDYVTAIAQHSKQSSAGHIAAWEVWNEPHNTWEWNGTQAQLVRMASDARSIIKSIDPKAIMLSPTLGWSDKQARDWMANYLAAGGGQYFDVVSLHGYVFNAGSYGPPENMIDRLAKYRAVLKQYGQGSKPIWDTETSWANTQKARLNDRDLQAAFVARIYLLHAANSIHRLFWFLWNGGLLGGLWLPDRHDHTKKGTLLKAGIAYQQIQDWLVGATMPTGCSANLTTWTCQLSRPVGYQGLVVWDTAQTCHNGKCQTVPYSVDSKYLNYRTLYGGRIPITNGTVQIGALPIVAENQ
ncbi:MAG TPA: cellulase family glycosylhydrolase [Terriglobales bacterium]|nr:cellulase family glycosylhydrolase [Terriglobales bacterium]